MNNVDSNSRIVWNYIKSTISLRQIDSEKKSFNQLILETFKAEIILYRLPRILSSNYINSYFVLLKILYRYIEYTLRPNVFEFSLESNNVNAEVIVLNVNAGFYRESLLTVKDKLSDDCGLSVLVLYKAVVYKFSKLRFNFITKQVFKKLTDFDKKLTFIQKLSIALEFNFVLTCEKIRFSSLSSFNFQSTNRLILSNDFADPRCRFFLLKAREAGLDVYLIQQGLVSVNYFEWDLNLADVTFCGGSRSIEVIRFQNPSLNLISTGLPNFDKVFQEPTVTSKFGNVLIATQPYFPGSFETNFQRMKIFFSAIFSFLFFTKNIVTIKPHPSDRLKYNLLLWLPAFLTGRLRFVDRLSPIDESIRLCDIVVTSYSQSSIFAIIQDKPAIFLYFSKERHKIEYIYSGVGEYFESLSALVIFLKENKDLSKLKINKSMLEDYIGVLDGKASHRIASYIKSQL
jgi:hypothetical protein